MFDNGNKYYCHTKKGVPNGEGFSTTENSIKFINEFQDKVNSNCNMNKMVLYAMVNLKIIDHMARVWLYTQIKINMKEIFKMNFPIDSENNLLKWVD